MTTGPTDAKVTTAAGGPGGMPAALRLSEGLGLAGRTVMFAFIQDLIVLLRCLMPVRWWLALWTAQLLAAYGIGWLGGTFGHLLF